MHEVLKAAIAPERSAAERLKSLAELREFLRDEAVVHELAAAARVEETLEVRRAMLQAMVACDVTRLKDRAPYVDALSYFATAEAEPDLRLIAVAWLGELAAHDPAVESVLSETLVCDLHEKVQEACITGLMRCARKSRETVAKILAYGRRAPLSMRSRLLDLVAQLGAADQQSALVALLHPWEPPAIRAQVLDRLASFPSLSTEAAAALVAHVRQEPDRGLRRKAVAILAAASHADPALFSTALELLEEVPDHAELLAAFRDRLASFPDLVGKLQALFGKSGSPRLKIALVDLLGESCGVDLAVAVLRDPNPWVRYRAITLCGALLPRHPVEVMRALAAAIPAESVVTLREAMVRQFLGSGRKEKEIERALVAIAEKETEPAIEEALIGAVLGVAIDDDNRAALLRIYRKVLTEPFFDPRTKAAVLDRLKAYAYRDEPELVECFKSILERTPDIETVDALHEQLRKLEPDLASLAPLFVKLFYRFAHHYARDPLHQWVKDFRDLAPNHEEIRGHLATVVQLTGATWAMDQVDASAAKSVFRPAMLEALSSNSGYRAAQNLLDEAWEKRTLKKSDLLWLFRRLLVTPQQDGLKQQVMKIMTEGKLVNGEIVDACLAHLQRHGDYEVKKFLEEAGPAEPTYRERVVKAFTQEAYSDYGRRREEANDVKEPPRTWNNWEYQGWRLMHPGWAIGELFTDLYAFDEFERALSSPPDPSVPAVKSIHYVVLEAMWRLSGKDWGRFQKITADEFACVIRGAGALMRQSTGALRDRAVAVVKAMWRFFLEKKGQVTPELADIGGEASIELLKLNAGFGNKPDAEEAKPLAGSSGETMERLWPFDRAAWPDFYASKVKVATPEEEARAKELWPKAYRGDVEALKELAGPLRHTPTARSRAKQIAAALARAQP
jgi:hypothetical protein